jgi:small subunit ribosomal protein S9
VSETDNPEGPRSEEPEVTPEERPAETTASSEESAAAAAEEPAAEAAAAEEPAAEESPAAAAEEPAAEEPAAEVPPAAAAEEPPAEEPPAAAAEEPPAAAAEEPPAEEPAAAAAEESPAEEPTAPAAEQDAEPAAAEQPASEQPVAPAEQPASSGDDTEEDVAPRVRPEIPGADLIPDIVNEGDEYLDAEARAAAEADAEAAALGEGDDEASDAQPIPDAAIDLASGARYTATGKRKSAVGRVILKPGTGAYTINGKTLDEFFPRATLQRIIRQPLETVGYDSRMDVIARMHGGGVAAQAGALRHGISKALLEADPNLRGELKRRGFLTRDPRVKERKKAGLKKARKRPQFSKR